MQVATTLQVRAAIKQAAEQLNMTLDTSWTNKRMNEDADRSVCFSTYSDNAAPLAMRAVKILAKQGLSSTITTGDAGCSPSGYGRCGSYVRATCNLA